MRKFILFSFITLALFAGSCRKTTTNPPIDYLVDTSTNVYLNQDDSLHLPLEVRFLAGNSAEPVTLTIEGLPSTVKMVQDSITVIPTGVANFILYTTPGAPLGYYPVRLVSYSPSTGYRTYDFTLGVVNYNCSFYLAGNYNCLNKGKTTYSYTGTATANGDTAINMVNLGGYGLNTNTHITLNCNTDSVTIRKQVIGNGVTVSGQGHFEANKMVIRYIALNIPTGGNDTVVVTMTK